MPKFLGKYFRYKSTGTVYVVTCDKHESGAVELTVVVVTGKSWVSLYEVCHIDPQTLEKGQYEQVEP